MGECGCRSLELRQVQLHILDGGAGGPDLLDDGQEDDVEEHGPVPAPPHAAVKVSYEEPRGSRCPLLLEGNVLHSHTDHEAGSCRSMTGACAGLM